MGRGWLWLLIVPFVSAGQLLAQAPPTANPPEGVAPADAKGPGTTTTEPALTLLPGTADSIAAHRTWARVDYLLWLVQPAPLPVPIVTTGDPRVGVAPNPVNTVNTAGAIGQPGTRVLLGDDTIRFGPASGVRGALGGWIDDDHHFGIEGSGFVLARQSNTFSAASDSTGNPPLYFPIFSAIAGAERGIPIADPLRGFSGDVTVSSTVQLWGAEANGLLAVYRNRDLEWTVLAGVRYADLRENLRIHNTTTDLLFGNAATLNDAFGTRNQFYGGQIGSRLAVQVDRFFLDIAGKVALGETRQLIAIQGDITQTGPNPLVPPGRGTFPGGLFAQPTNIGQHNTSPLTVPFTTLASLELRLGYAVTRWIGVYAGYDLFLWNNVVRPGDQVNHVVNLTQNAVLDPNGVGRLVGPAQPALVFNRSDFWAQGITFGVECRY